MKNLETVRRGIKTLDKMVKSGETSRDMMINVLDLEDDLMILYYSDIITYEVFETEYNRVDDLRKYLIDVTGGVR